MGEEVMRMRQAERQADQAELAEMKRMRQADQLKLEEVERKRQVELAEMKKMRQLDQIRLEDVERKRRSDDAFMAEMKKLIQSQIKKNRPEHSTCQMGNETTTKGASSPKEKGFELTKTVPFGKSFQRTPKVIASISSFYRNQQGKGDTWWGLKVEARKVTTSSFDLYMNGYGTKVTLLTA